MKKYIIVFVFISLLAILAFTGCKETPSEGKTRVASENLYSDEGYIDYAKEVCFDVEKYPDMAEMGLFWTKWDEETQKIVQIPADSEEGAALVDPNKPTIINVHGVLLNGHTGQEQFNLNTRVANPEEFDLDTSYVPLNYLWIKEGWNVANFHYNRFASEGLGVTNIEYKIWSNEGEYGVRYRHANGEYSENDITEYCLAEHFAAEYIRAMQYLPKEMGSKEIRVAAHSMGGELTTATLFLLTELADDGQLPFNQLPDRFALLDSYFSTALEVSGEWLYIGPVDCKIRWSGKELVDNHVGKTMIECLKDLVANNIAIEYYTYDNANFVNLGVKALQSEFLQLSTYVVIFPDWQGNGYSPVKDGHNAVREWYLCSLLSDPIKDISNGNDTGDLAPSAALPTEKLSDLRNIEFLHVGGVKTVNAWDDTMTRKYHINYNLNGGVNTSSNPKFYTNVSETIPLMAPTKKGSTFDGWYLKSDFSGDRITTINPSDKKDITLYAKWK